MNIRYKAWIVVGKHGRPAVPDSVFARPRVPIFFDHADADALADYYNRISARKPAQPYTVEPATVEVGEPEPGPVEKRTSNDPPTVPRPNVEPVADDAPGSPAPAAEPEPAPPLADTKPNPVKGTKLDTGLFGKGKA